jgi:ubiquinone/menaquinone biosynthesis C-methylase UbiE
MIPYSKDPVKLVHSDGLVIPSFVPENYPDADERTLKSFGDEWNKFADAPEKDLQNAFREYFDIIPGNAIDKTTVLLDIGCGSGRWSKILAEKAGEVHAIDPGPAVKVAARQLRNNKNVFVAQAGFGCLPFEENTFDFVLCLGVAHHLPDPQKAIGEMMKMLKKNGRILIYMYYNLSERSFFYRFLFKISRLLNRMISPLPKSLKLFFSDLLAIFAAGPFVLFVKMMRILFPSSHGWKKLPFSYYADKSWKIVRNDSLDRFGTPLVKRFSKKEITALLEQGGFSAIHFSDQAPFWHVTAIK